jgi:peptidoglycan/xylan/chitin deacetylase (PgdA/CDA1 family)
MPLLTDAGLAEDLTDAGRIITETTGADPRPWFRCPFGAGADDPRVQAAVRAAGYRHVGWHVGVEDWDPAKSAATIEHQVVEGTLAHGDGAVVLLHAWPTATREAIGAIAGRLRDAGATFVTIDALGEVPGAVT